MGDEPIDDLCEQELEESCESDEKLYKDMDSPWKYNPYHEPERNLAFNIIRMALLDATTEVLTHRKYIKKYTLTAKVDAIKFIMGEFKLKNCLEDSFEYWIKSSDMDIDIPSIREKIEPEVKKLPIYERALQKIINAGG